MLSKRCSRPACSGRCLAQAPEDEGLRDGMRRGATVPPTGLPKLECQRVGTDANAPAWVEFGTCARARPASAFARRAYAAMNSAQVVNPMIAAKRRLGCAGNAMLLERMIDISSQSWT